MSEPSQQRERQARLAGDVAHTIWLSRAAALWGMSFATPEREFTVWLHVALSGDGLGLYEVVRSGALSLTGWASGIWLMAASLGLLQSRFTWNISAIGTRGSGASRRSTFVDVFATIALTIAILGLVRWVLIVPIDPPAELLPTRDALRLLGSACAIVGVVDLTAATWARRRRLVANTRQARKDSEAEAASVPVRQRLAQLRRKHTDG